MKHVIPLTITFVGMLTFNNLCLKYVGVAFFQVRMRARSLARITARKKFQREQKHDTSNVVPSPATKEFAWNYLYLLLPARDKFLLSAQVARSMTLVFTVIFSILILHQKISLRVMLCCLCVAGGFVLGVDQEHLKGVYTCVCVCVCVCVMQSRPDVCCVTGQT